MKPHAFAYERPVDVAEVCQYLQQGEDARPLAGGQSLGPMLNLRLAQPETLLDVSSLPMLRSFDEQADGLMIGAAVTHAEIEDGLLPDTTRGILPRIASGIAYRAVRSRGTIGGSLAHADPAADWLSSLCALGAEVMLESAESRRRLRLGDFILGAFHTALQPGELLTAVWVPRVVAGSRFGYFKLCRKTGELAHAIGAVYEAGDTGAERLVMGATQGRPVILEGDDAADPERWLARLEQQASGLDTLDRNQHIEALKRAQAMSESL